MHRRITTEDVRSFAIEKGLPLTAAQIAQVVGAAGMVQECAARLRAGLRRNDEPAFGFRHPEPASTGKQPR